MAKTSTTALRSTSRPDPKSIEGVFAANEEAMKRALVGEMTPQRMLSLTLGELRRNKKLKECTPHSIFSAVLQAGQLGLEPSSALGHAYLVPYGKECTLILGYRGLIELALRSGKVSNIMARCVYERDGFEVRLGTEERIEHVPEYDEERGKLIAVYAVAHMTDGSYVFDVLPRDEVERHRSRSKAKDSGPWVTDYDAMSRKTAIRALWKYLPSNVISNAMVERVESIEQGITIEGTLDTETGELTPPETPSEAPQAPKPDPAPKAQPKAEKPPEPEQPAAETRSERAGQIQSMISRCAAEDEAFLRDTIKAHRSSTEQAILNDALDERLLVLQVEPPQQEIE